MVNGRANQFLIPAHANPEHTRPLASKRGYPNVSDRNTGFSG
jgi:hypothetical protein